MIVFGPIVSRRFGISLGVDLSPFEKQCNFDCVYCELKPKRAQEKFSRVLDLDELISSVKSALEAHQNIDVLTITANGEPTLYPHLYEFIRAIKPFIPSRAKSLILSNGSRFGDVKIQKALSEFNIVKFSLDSGEMRSFKKIDRAHKSLNLEDIKNGIKSFAKIRRNMLVCEILVVKNINDNARSLEPLAEFLREINVDRIDLGTLDRPPAYPVEAVSSEKLIELSEIFEGLFISIATRKNANINETLNLDSNEIKNLLKRRPLEKNEIANMLSAESLCNLESLLKSREIKVKKVGLVDFYTL